MKSEDRLGRADISDARESLSTPIAHDIQATSPPPARALRALSGTSDTTTGPRWCVYAPARQGYGPYATAPALCYLQKLEVWRIHQNSPETKALRCASRSCGRDKAVPHGSTTTAKTIRLESSIIERPRGKVQ